MALSGFLFVSWRLFEIILLVPIVGMLGWFVHEYVKQNLLTPQYILVLFIVSVIALAWVFLTTVDYLRARHDAFFVALFDLGIIGGLIAGVYYLRHYASADCTNSSATLNGGFSIHVRANKQCVMLKACFALGIINILAFFVTFLLALLVARHHRKDDQVVVKREYRSSSRHGGGHRRSSGSRDYRSSRDYGYDSRPSGSRRSHQSSRRQYYV